MSCSFINRVDEPQADGVTKPSFLSVTATLKKMVWDSCTVGTITSFAAQNLLIVK